VLIGAIAAWKVRGGGAAPTYIFNSSITKEQVLEAQKAWGDGIVKISAAHANGEDFTFLAKEHIRNLYGYGLTDILFKPTLASDIQFRSTFEEALSYFVATNGKCAEDKGFAIKGWKAVRWENVDITTSGNTAMAMGNYFFTTPEGGEVKVEYTFGYFLDAEGKVRINLHHSSVPYDSGVTKEEAIAVQNAWAGAIKNISKVYKDKGDYVQAAADAAGELYGYGKGNVLFKPTKAREYTFRPTAEEAMSYFVGEGAVENGYKEDGGFAINGGKGWADCVYNNHMIEPIGGIAIAMGTYDFTCATTGDVSTVEYTFGYKRCDDGKVRIFLHHSSVPFSAAPAPVTEAEVIAVQNAWAGAIKNISKVYKDKGDYVQAAADAAGELYAYGKGNVLFKPTKAREYQFRPTAEEAMSYFVGNDAVENGYKEDGGFAINGGKGFSDCVYKNHQIELKGGIGIAMGTYDFTCATTGDVSTVEYTFGYKRCDDGKVRIFLHHSSVPYSA
jgi:hypothetical protein